MRPLTITFSTVSPRTSFMSFVRGSNSASLREQICADDGTAGATDSSKKQNVGSCMGDDGDDVSKPMKRTLR
eukprot:15462873-Alexandrium_andersonii.AAC.1